MTVRFLRVSYALWLIVPVLLAGLYFAFGTPHLRWQYTFRDDGQGYDPFAKRFYLRCTYLGPEGHFTVTHPAQGHCSLIRFAKHQRR